MRGAHGRPESRSSAFGRSPDRGCEGDQKTLSEPERPGTSPCPECGARISARGLAGHRRLKHGHVAPASAARRADLLPELTVVLETMGRMLERVDSRLGRLEETVRLELAAPARPGGAHPERLRGELDDVLQETAFLKTLARSSFESWGGTPRNEQEQELASAWRRQLGTLSRRHFQLLVRLHHPLPEGLEFCAPRADVELAG